MLRQSDPWALMDELAEAWSAELAEAADARFDSGSTEDRKRLIWLLGRVRIAAAGDVLRRWLARTSGNEADSVLVAMNGRRWAAPSDQIRRLIDEAPEAAVVAAGLSGEVALAPLLEARLDAPKIGRHAALALALLGQSNLAPVIAARIEGASGIDAAGFVTALETMRNTSVVPLLRALLDAPSNDARWDVHHALCRLTGREPLIALQGGDEAIAKAWRGFRTDGPRRPVLTLDDVEACSASFTLEDGGGAVRIDYEPPTPGSVWPRWGLALYVGEHALYALGSHCGTCETTLRLLRESSERVATVGDQVRSALANVAGLDGELFAALRPYLVSLRTGHYRAYLRDFDLELVEKAEDSWFTRRHHHRVSEDTPEAAGPSAYDVAWPGVAHFQTRRGPSGERPTYGVVVPSMPLDGLDQGAVDAHAERIADGCRPTALLLGWVEDKEVAAEFPERFANMFVLDGHHKLAAYAERGVAARCLVLCRLEDSWGPPGDREAYLREAMRDLASSARELLGEGRGI